MTPAVSPAPRLSIRLFCIALILGACDSDVHDRRDIAAARSANSYEPLDLAYDSATKLTATFVAPGGETLRSESFPSGPRQVVRVTPTAQGLWRYTIRTSATNVATGELRVFPRDAPGFIRAQGHTLVHSNGTPVVDIGENRINLYDPAWNWKALPIEAYLDHMAQHGERVVRVFIVSDVENEADGGRNRGVLEPVLGQFDEQVAQQFDRIFRGAQSRGIAVILVAFALGFSEKDDWKSWQDNPYSAERGGPAKSRYDFFDSPAVRQQAAQRIRYLAARYAPFPNLLAIDLLNEPEWDGAIPEVSWTAWAEVMAAEWRRADPYHHLVTVGSVGLHWNIEGDERAWWASNACDLVQWHLYGPEVYDVHALASEMSRKTRETWIYGKPVLVGEFAYGGEAKPEYDHTHVGLWSAAFSGAGVLAHSAPAFNVDSDELMTPERAAHFRVLGEVLSGLPNVAPVEARASRNASAQALLAEHDGAVWILASRNSYGSTAKGIQATLPSVTRGLWQVRWLDDVSGKIVSEAQARADEGALTLDVPDFSRHIVARLRWLRPPPG
jgi:hypothetical protein